MPDVITNHLDIWTSPIIKKSNVGRGSKGKQTAYGIKKLRELILELAVRGKLVPQNSDDEPSRVLLERLDKERTRFLKKDKIKKLKPLSGISDDEKTYRLPDGWSWFRVGSYLNFQYGKAMSAKDRDESGTVDVYGSNGIVGKHTESLLNEPCIVIGRKGSAGALNKALNPSWTTDVAYYLVPPVGFDLDYTFNILETLRLNELGKGIKPGVNRNEAYVLVAALPPLAEQHRIVAKVDELMALCDQLEQQQSDSNTAHQCLVETLLGTLTQVESREAFTTAWQRIAKHFDTLFTTADSIDQLKQTLLQLAVMGKLAPQDPNDEPAHKLLKRMELAQDEWLGLNQGENKECATMIRKLKKLNLAKPPYVLPTSWGCIHLIQACQALVDCHNKTAPYVESGIPIIRTSNIRERVFRMSGIKYVNKETYDYWSRRCPPIPGDIMFTREAPMGEAAIIPDGVMYCLGQRTMLIRPMPGFVLAEYLLLALTEPNLLERASEHAIGSTVKHLRVGDVENLNIPLPPLAEQHRIVAKVDELMALCDALKTRLNDAQNTQAQLADAIVEKAVA